MNETHYGAIIKKFPKFYESINPNLKCITIENHKSEGIDSDIPLISQAGVFVLNFFGQTGSLRHGLAFSLRESRAVTVSIVNNMSHTNINGGAKFAIEPSTNPSSITVLFESTMKAYKVDRSLQIAIRKFNSALSKESIEEQIIDLSICLEAIFNSQTEISFRFSLYNSVLAESTAKRRFEIFNIMKKLYAQRSNIVHGNSEVSHAWVNENWTTVVKIAKLALARKIDYLQNNPVAGWQNWIDRLALGATETELAEEVS